ncbi:MAG: acyl--CoA ligase [Candidatus Dormibacteraeota bacterium]|nr:acyl--CoA ligase [Candidatus Dormibacteraeota bacterium]
MSTPLTDSLAELVSSAARRWGADVAIACGSQRLTYSQLDRAAARIAEDLSERGLEAGDPVAVVAGTGVEFPVLAHGALRAGGVLVPISPASPPREVAGLLRAAKVELVLCDADHEGIGRAAVALYDPGCGVIVLDAAISRSRGDTHALRKLVEGRDTPGPPPRVAAGSPAVILFTSGSTARPKGVVHSHEGLLNNARCVAFEMAGLTRKDVMLGALPLAHSFGLSAVMNASLLAGARLELMPQFGAQEAWKLVLEREVTVVTGVPTMFRRLAELREASRNSDLRLGIVSGSTCPRPLARDVRLRLGIEIIERYGMTEASPLTWRLVEDGTPEGDVGYPGWGVRLRVVDDRGQVTTEGTTGEVEVQAPGMLLRYLAPADNRDGFRDGWLRTGDLGSLGPDGGLTLAARLKEVIIRGGFTISAREVEAVIEQHPAVAEAAVVGLPDDDMGEDIAAMVVLKTGKKAEAADLWRFVGERLAGWKRPRRWRVVAEIPRSPLGKIRRDEIARSWGEG